MGSKITYAALAPQYAAMWQTAELKPSMIPEAQAVARKVLAGRGRYEAVSTKTGVPWVVIGLIHAMEAGCDFGCHLHNGDSLAAKTVNEPKNRPIGNGPFMFEESAVDALRFDKLDKVKAWPLERMCFEIERYNGWGYRNSHSTVPSPYLWSGTNQYVSGKFVADKVWSATAVSGQPGALAILKCLIELDASLAPVMLSKETPSQEGSELTSDSFRKAVAPVDFVPIVRAGGAALVAAGTGTAAGTQIATTAAPIPAVPTHITEGIANASAWQDIALQVKSMGAAVVAAPLTFAGIGAICVLLWFAPKLLGGNQS